MNKLVTLMTCAVLICGSAAAADPGRHEQIELAQGAALKKLSGKIKGDETVEYRIAVPAGGALNLKLKSANRSTYFNVSAEGAEEAIFVGSRDGDHFTITAPAGAVYKVSVYLMRNAARRHEKASYVIEAVASAPMTPR
ncbi:DNA breaking-rejoining protein [Janthinobacterium lividum]|uniref:DNA breaking-rejoining protein n=1 Tax=Janthinobacterium TaxID=29580 RepID=UPI000C0F4DDA|nr:MULTISPECIES: DNA breaking-rejoining protein [Janthinobacterium]PHV28747.1 DNA breaking-rejoining protein [Janthinobacterium sp. BJB426]QKY01479.1 DNA breaking-rejoining protein [Janthinobacterium lividum]